MNKNLSQLKLANAIETKRSKAEPSSSHRMKNQLPYRRLSKGLPTIYEDQMLISPKKPPKPEQQSSSIEEQIAELSIQLKAMGTRAAKRPVPKHKIDINGKENVAEANLNMMLNKYRFPVDGKPISSIPVRIPLSSIDINKALSKCADAKKDK